MNGSEVDVCAPAKRARETKAMRVMVNVKVNELADARVSANFG